MLLERFGTALREALGVERKRVLDVLPTVHSQPPRLGQKPLRLVLRKIVERRGVIEELSNIGAESAMCPNLVHQGANKRSRNPNALMETFAGAGGVRRHAFHLFGKDSGKTVGRRPGKAWQRCLRVLRGESHRKVRAFRTRRKGALLYEELTAAALAGEVSSRSRRRSRAEWPSARCALSARAKNYPVISGRGPGHR